MSKVRTVTLEFVRRGPAHNQLLSPLTDYIGLCGNYGTVTVHVPYEHQDFLRHFKELRYQGTGQSEAESRQGVLNSTAKEITNLLASVPGLISGLNDAAGNGDSFTHLNLVLSASELALLPFELARVLPGCVGGEGNWLLLQTLAPVCLTRRVRSVSNDHIFWPRKPRILFVAAAPTGLKIPLDQHTQALLKAILPWVPPFDPYDANDLERKVNEILTILPNATIEEVEEVCSREVFTHVHVLAHGREDGSQPGTPFGLALHSRLGKEKVEVVSGARFAIALGSLQPSSPKGSIVREKATLPVVVTVATCDSGHVSSVIYSNGASFAHDLHQAGIPFVVASQFPLSFAGSVAMVEILYQNLLWGQDPRMVLPRLRTKLFSLQGNVTHDWASLVVYAALPDDLEIQLKDVQYEQARRAVDTALAHLDYTIDRMARDESGATTENEGTSSSAPAEKANDLVSLFEQVDKATEFLPVGGEYETEGIGMLASIEKRKAEAWYRASRVVKDQKLEGEYRRQCMKTLRQARHYYERAVHENMQQADGLVLRKRSLHWVMGQYLSLRAVLGETFLRDHWGAALVSAQLDLSESLLEIRAWAHGTLAELYLLLLAYDQKGLPAHHKSAKEKVREHVRQLVAITGPDSSIASSTQRQFKRYVQCWGSEDFVTELRNLGGTRERDWSDKGGLTELALQIVRLLSVY
jgi:hypothetical protein